MGPLAFRLVGDSGPLDARFLIEEQRPVIEVTIESRGPSRNREYGDGLRVLLSRLLVQGWTLEDARLSSSVAATLADDQTLLKAGRPHGANVNDPELLAAALQRDMAGTGRGEGARGGGNPTKRMTMRWSRDGAGLQDALADLRPIETRRDPTQQVEVPVLCVHINKRSGGERNWEEVGRPRQIWGFPAWREDFLSPPPAYAIFSLGVPYGTRQPLKEWRGRTAREVVVAEILSLDPAQERVWREETPQAGIQFPVRLNLRILDEWQNVPLGDAGPLSEAISDGLRRGANGHVARVPREELLALVSEAAPPAETGSGATANATGSRSWMSDPAARTVVEHYAVKRAKAYYEALHPGVPIMEFGAPFDLQVMLGEQTLHVEVKGTTNSGGSVEITRNEFNHAADVANGAGCTARVALPAEAEPCQRCDLLVVSDIELDRTVVPPVASGGSVWQWEGFDPTGRANASRFDLPTTLPDNSEGLFA